MMDKIKKLILNNIPFTIAQDMQHNPLLDTLKYVLQKHRNVETFDISEDKKIFAYYCNKNVYVLDVLTKKELYKIPIKYYTTGESIILNKDGSCIIYYDVNRVYIIKNNYNMIMNNFQSNSLSFHPFDKNILFTWSDFCPSLDLYSVKYRPVIVKSWYFESKIKSNISASGNYIKFNDEEYIEDIDISNYNYVKNFRIILKKFFYKDILDMIEEYL